MAWLELVGTLEDPQLSDVNVRRAADGILWVELPDVPLTIGRRGPREPGQPHLRISDVMLARCHCSVQPTSDGFALRDEASPGGTWLNDGERVTSTPRPLREGDRIWLGSRERVIVFRIGPPP